VKIQFTVRATPYYIWQALVDANQRALWDT
jgi:uncharacterized protein YndB with AHSA1/START domain